MRLAASISLLLAACGGSTTVGAGVDVVDIVDDVTIDTAPDVPAPPDVAVPVDVEPPDVAVDVAPPPPVGWQRIELGAAGDLHAVRFLGGRFLAAGDGGSILRPHGAGWAREWTPEGAGTLRDVAESPQGLDAVGLGGTWLARGPDGAWRSAATTSLDLFAVVAIGGDAVAVGAQGVILRRIGDALVPEASGIALELLGVASLGGEKAVAVGAGGIALHRIVNGTWQQVQAAPASVTLRGVHALGEKDVWAVGDGGSVFHYAGDWQAEPTSDTRDLYAVAGGTGLLAVGDAGAFLVRTADGSWGIATDVQGPLFTTRGYHGVAAGGDRIVAAGAGGALQVKQLPKGPFLDAASRPAAAIRDLASLGEVAVAAGDDGLVVRIDAGGYGAVDAGTNEHLLGVDLAPNGTIWAAGAGGTLVRLQAGAPPMAVVTGTVADLRSVRVLGDGSAIVVGDAGVALHVSASGAQVESEPTPAGEDLLDVFLEGSDAIAVGRGGTALRRSGTSWTALELGVAADLHAGDSSGGRTVIVGDFGTVISWTAEEGPISLAADPVAFYDAVDVHDDGTATIAGWAGALLRFENGGLSPITSPTGTPLRAAARHGDRLLVGGDAGELWQLFPGSP